MTPVYATVLLIGIILLIGWTIATAVGGNVAGWSGVDPERRFGRIGRYVVAGCVGFGMAGMSATFAGWPAALAFGGAIAGAVGLAVVAWYFGPRQQAA